MPLDDVGDASKQLGQMKKDIERLGLHAGAGGDSTHPGTGELSVQLGPNAEAIAYKAVSIGQGSDGWGEFSTAIGASSHALAEGSTALGNSAYTNNDYSTAVGAYATTTAASQIMLGTSGDTVVVPGTFSNPSARRLKRNIIPAPDLRDIFPELTEWEYIDGDGRRRIGYIADDLMGTDAERFVTLDDDGAPNGIDYLSLLVAQVAQLSAELTALKNEMKG